MYMREMLLASRVCIAWFQAQYMYLVDSADGARLTDERTDLTEAQ